MRKCSLFFRQKASGMPRLIETYASKLPPAKEATRNLWDSEMKGFCLVPREAIDNLVPPAWLRRPEKAGSDRSLPGERCRKGRSDSRPKGGRGAERIIRVGAPTLQGAMEACLGRPTLRPETRELNIRQQFDGRLRDWMRRPSRNRATPAKSPCSLSSPANTPNPRWRPDRLLSSRSALKRSGHSISMVAPSASPHRNAFTCRPAGFLGEASDAVAFVKEWKAKPEEALATSLIRAEPRPWTLPTSS